MTLTYVYVEIDGRTVDVDDALYARRALEESCRLLDLPEPIVRWYVSEEVAGRHVLTKFGRQLDRQEDQNLHGWYRFDATGDQIAVRADQGRVAIGLTVAHEVRHAWQEANGRPISEADAEAFAGRVVATIGVPR